MNNYESLKPKYRSELRSYLGKKFYQYKRYAHWLLTSEKCSKNIGDTFFENIVFHHRTPLYRKLKNVDMWLQENKVVNLTIAIKKINGIIIYPGETLSYWRLIGNPSASKGYKKGMVLHYGKFKSGVGGGLCQLSNMIYWMALHTPLTVVERHRHSFDVFPDSNRTQPFGSGATCVYNYKDLKIKNDTDEIYQLNFVIEGDFLTGRILSNKQKYFEYKVYEKNHQIIHQYWGGYVRKNEIRREVKNMNNEIIDDVHICENNALMMYEPLIEQLKNQTS